MRNRILVPVLLTVLAGCNSPLDVTPAGSIPSETAINDAPSAQAALMGAYAVLQRSGYYGQDFTTFAEVSSDNAVHSGTRTEYAEASANDLSPENGRVASIWQAIYDGINRANEILVKVPEIETIDPDVRDEILGEAHFLRALHYHNLVKLWGGVPIRTEPAKSLADAADVSRASVDEVYQQILSDLAQAEQLITNEDETRQASVGAVQALKARVLLYKGDWARADSAAAAVEGMSYTLATNYSDLFTATGSDTPEDIFRVIFTPQQYNNVGYYYYTKSDFGIYELKPTLGAMKAFDPAFDTTAAVTTYNPSDTRGKWAIAIDSKKRVYAAKFRASAGSEHLHVIRLAEVILTRAEALARQGGAANLLAAVGEYNKVRVRANLTPHVLGTDVTTQQQVIDAILLERRRELAFEGDRWPDLVRTGLATTVLGIPATKMLFPIPQRELDVTPKLTQNPGYGGN